LLQKNLTICRFRPIIAGMAARTKATQKGRVATTVRLRIERGGERLWRLEDFRDLPFTAVAQALSRMARRGLIERLSKGTYYRTRDTAFGKSRPNPSDIRNLASRRKPLFPAGTAAANLLGFTTQTARQSELATSATSLPRKLIGSDAVVHTRRPEAWSELPEIDAAMLDFLRRGGRTSELAPEGTIRRTLALLSERGRFERLAAVAATEPPRVRALLGALAEKLGKGRTTLEKLRHSLNPLSRFEFGAFAAMSNARQWQAKERRP